MPPQSLSAVGRGIAPSRYGSLCLNIDETAESIASIFLSASAREPVNTDAKQPKLKVSDFVFALYGEWGRGKSTLMGKVADLLTQASPVQPGKGVQPTARNRKKVISEADPEIRARS